MILTVWMTLEERYYGMAQYLITVDISGNINSENVRCSMVVMGESTPYMYASSSIPVMLDLHMH